MKAGEGLLAIMAVAAIAVIPADIFYTSRFVPRFKEVEQQRIVISNQLATAKIVSENLNHVRDLVYRNMEFAGQKDSLPPHETQFYEFLTECVNDLKMRIIYVRPLQPEIQGRVTTYSYDIAVEGDFFAFGELCSKFENSRRVMALTSFEITQAGTEKTASEPASGKGKQPAASQPPPGRRGALIKFHLDTFRVRKG